jgi:hypothetical protein
MTSTPAQPRLASLQWAIIVLTVATALIHIGLGMTFLATGGALFVLNGFGYLGLLALLYWPAAVLDRYRSWVRWLLIAYTAVTIMAWLFTGLGSPLAGMPVEVGDTKTLVAYVDKVIEVVLIGLLWIDGNRSRKTG